MGPGPRYTSLQEYSVPDLGRIIVNIPVFKTTTSLPLRFFMFLKAFVILALGVASTNATGAWSTTRTARIGPDARTYRQNHQVNSVKGLQWMMTAVAQKVLATFGDKQYSIYSGSMPKWHNSNQNFSWEISQNKNKGGGGSAGGWLVRAWQLFLPHGCFG